ncbi:MAG: hypothetical protein ACI8QC_001997 [Planctomycetota bacterium]|jgi:hypothetical protein
MSSEFYVGYMPEQGPKLARFTRRVVLVLLLCGLGLGALLVRSMGEFSSAVFEFGVERSFEGVLAEGAVPVLRVARPGESSAGASSYLLVAFGKHGASQEVLELGGHRVRLSGSLIYRDDQTMIEVADGSLEDLGLAEAEPALEQELGMRVLTGEIVDSKCFLGVMKPGNLKPHRACAVRCISGGVPPVLLVRDAEGTASYYLLVGADGSAVGQQILDVVAEPIRVEGRVVRRAGLAFLYADPSTYETLE